jgi:hypothetical protein
MKIIDLIENIDNYDDDQVVYASEPWSAESKVEIYNCKDKLPLEINNYSYFLEISIINEILDSLDNNEYPSISDKCNRIIKYAINDA